MRTRSGLLRFSGAVQRFGQQTVNSAGGASAWCGPASCCAARGRFWPDVSSWPHAFVVGFVRCPGRTLPDVGGGATLVTSGRSGCPGKALGRPENEKSTFRPTILESVCKTGLILVTIRPEQPDAGFVWFLPHRMSSPGCFFIYPPSSRFSRAGFATTVVACILSWWEACD